ncbi:MAG: bifunctional homocysteine S-methyltransferase/methylenetetrahydrofolate reductase [Gemmatimonadota bacterium]|nr:bifunctional homocysteine S-methyltransferase/methylenetetrahydrofolate reductase [bacterium]MDE2845193.1 bifunctional homocysteine S-methyltransferase/methylenetetrahydrofolate reductase [Gemmatimonadota bacterium]
MNTSLLDHLRSSLLVADGAIGTMLYARGVPMEVCFDEINLSQPDLIRKIHEEYVDAGARLIETNTFGANALSLSKYNLEDQAESLNARGVEIARQAVGNRAYVAGAVGPARGLPHREYTEDDHRRVYTEQIAALAGGGADAIILETFLRLDDLKAALTVCREVCGLPLICQLAVDQYGQTDDGFEVAEAFDQLRAAGADVVGVNCRSGPKGLLDALAPVPLTEGLVLSAFPNAGSPVYVDGRFIYEATPEYFATSALRLRDQGVRLIGGCCGTMPEHVQAMSRALEGREIVTRKKVPRVEVRVPAQPTRPAGTARPARPAPAPPPVEPSIVELVKERVTVIVELDPPRDLDHGPIVRGAKALKKAGADALTMADNSLAVTRISNMAVGQIVKEEAGIRPLLHITCRDRNLASLQSQVLGLHALGIDHVLAVTGDPVKFGDQPGASNVYDVSSFELIRLIKQMNEGVGFSGRTLNGSTAFTVAAAFDPNGPNLERRIRRLERKVEAGADMIMTQPLFDHRQAKQLYEATRDAGVPILPGVMPLVSDGNTEFLHNEVPGFVVPDDVRARMARVGRGRKARREGVAIARELIESVLTYFNGLYLITPFNRYPMTVELTEFALQAAARNTPG